jgi:hypothetical protein
LLNQNAAAGIPWRLIWSGLAVNALPLGLQLGAVAFVLRVIISELWRQRGRHQASVALSDDSIPSGGG